jgi:fucose permease
MKKLFRIILFFAALAIGGWLGTIFLAEFEPLKMLAFFAFCGVLGVAFHLIDKRITKDK